MSAIPRKSSPYDAPSPLDRALDLSRLNLDLLLMVGLVLLSIVTHLWALGHMAMHHDESIHAWMSWKFFTGAGGFSCAGGRSSSTYCYDPTYHGPSLYMFTLVSYLLFGVGEAQARLPQAVAGVLLVASSWMLRPYLGRRGTLIAATLLAFAPTLLYFTRFARHDGLMILWTFWIVIGFFRYLDSGRPGFLYLSAAGVGLAMATHEVYYILFFLFGTFLLIRLCAELLPRQRVTIGLAVILALALLLMFWNPQVTEKLSAGGPAMLLAAVIGMGLLMMRVWDPAPIVATRLISLWREQRRALWIALAIIAVIFATMYSTFFAEPRGIIDGLYQGLAYWLGSQHEYRRADQPWYYYLMLMPLYEPIGFFVGLGAAVFMFIQPATGGWGFARRAPAPAPAAAEQDAAAADAADSADSADGADDGAVTADAATIDLSEQPAARDPQLLAALAPTAVALFPLFLAFWFIGTLVGLSWAGEKMPWLNAHIALPACLLAAWALGRVLDSVQWRALPDRRAALVPPALLLLLIALGVALWRLGAPGEGQQAQANLLQGLIPLAIVGALIYSILTIGQSLGARPTLALCVLTIAGLMGITMTRATWMLVYDHPDTPRELMIYTQTSPDVPLIVNDLRTLAVNQTRNSRTPNDPIGGETMPLIMDVGDASGDGSLDWPFLWYLRDFQRIERRQADFFRSATADAFQVAVDASQPNGEKEFAPAVMVYVPHMTDATREALEANYVKRYDAKLNWWFPEGNKCDPAAPGYKRFYYSQATFAQAVTDCKNPNLDPAQFGSVLAPLLWPFDRSSWADTWRFLLFRELPESLRLDGREMQVWVRKDLAPAGSASGGSSEGPLKLVAEQVYGAPGQDAGQLDQPRGAAVDAQGNLYVADTGNHRVVVFGPDGKPLRTIGGFGSGQGQFNEPRGVATDAQGNLYVADTWNARVVKFDPSGAYLTSWGEGKQDFGSGRRATMTDGSDEGNAAEPLGFFGPRAVAVDTQGRVYIADTGNKRIVVTDGEGKYLYQWGHAGAEPGAFSEPIGVAVDGAGNVYVADTWNGRVQEFSPGADGRVSPIPSVTWKVAGWQPNTYDDPFVAASQSGQVYVSVPSRSTMVYANARGDVLLRWGGKGNDFASLTLPSGVAVGPDGKVYVTDRGNGRVLRFSMPNIAAGTPDQP